METSGLLTSLPSSMVASERVIASLMQTSAQMPHPRQASLSRILSCVLVMYLWVSLELLRVSLLLTSRGVSGASLCLVDRSLHAGPVNVQSQLLGLHPEREE